VRFSGPVGGHYPLELRGLAEVGEAGRQEGQCFRQGFSQVVTFGSRGVPERSPGNPAIGPPGEPGGFAGDEDMLDQGLVLAALNPGPCLVVGQ